jgi:hypothetical protein
MSAADTLYEKYRARLLHRHVGDVDDLALAARLHQSGSMLGDKNGAFAFESTWLSTIPAWSCLPWPGRTQKRY